MEGVHILIVEDEEKVARILEEHFAEAGYKVTCHYSGEGAFEKVKAVDPALVLLDIMLPGVDGLAVFREIRKFSDVPVIMVTAKVSEVDRLIGLEIGADDYICKPFSPLEVVARARAVLRRMSSSPASSPRLTVGPLLLDDERHRVEAAGHLIDLTPCEFRLLKVFMEKPERVFSRSALLKKIQGYTFDGYDRAVDCHIKNLRRKIAEQVPNREFIVTVYGVGYALKDDADKKL